MNPEKLAKSATTDGQSPRPGYEDASAPAPIVESGPRKGQHEAYWVLDDEERSKGFIRPVRESYRHVGVRPEHPTRELTAEEHERYDRYSYVAYEEYPEARGSTTGRFWTTAQLNSGCGFVTSMGRALAETWARDISFYSATFCFSCSAHFPVDEFEWPDGSRLGS